MHSAETIHSLLDHVRKGACPSVPSEESSPLRDGQDNMGRPLTPADQSSVVATISGSKYGTVSYSLAQHRQMKYPLGSGKGWLSDADHLMRQGNS
jgi:hypothetical protein